MFVNDDVDTTAVIKEGLSMHGYEVETFVDPNLALQNFKESNCDLLLLDVRMRGLNGFELYNKMRKVDKNIKVCFISASNTFYEKYKRLYPEVQEKCYIQKPLRIKNLAGITGKILVNNRLLQSHYLAKKNRAKIENEIILYLSVVYYILSWFL